MDVKSYSYKILKIMDLKIFSQIMIYILICNLYNRELMMLRKLLKIFTKKIYYLQKKIMIIKNDSKNKIKKE